MSFNSRSRWDILQHFYHFKSKVCLCQPWNKCYFTILTDGRSCRLDHDIRAIQLFELMRRCDDTSSLDSLQGREASVDGCVVFWKGALHVTVTELCCKLLFSDPSGQKALQPLYTEVYAILQWWMQHVCDPMPFSQTRPIHPSHQPPLTEHLPYTLQEFSGSVSGWGLCIFI